RSSDLISFDIDRKRLVHRNVLGTQLELSATDVKIQIKVVIESTRRKKHARVLLFVTVVLGTVQEKLGFSLLKRHRRGRITITDGNRNHRFIPIGIRNFNSINAILLRSEGDDSVLRIDLHDGHIVFPFHEKLLVSLACLLEARIIQHGVYISGFVKMESDKAAFVNLRSVEKCSHRVHSVFVGRETFRIIGAYAKSDTPLPRHALAEKTPVTLGRQRYHGRFT